MTKRKPQDHRRWRPVAPRWPTRWLRIVLKSSFQTAWEKFAGSRIHERVWGGAGCFQAPHKQPGGATCLRKCALFGALWERLHGVGVAWDDEAEAPRSPKMAPGGTKMAHKMAPDSLKSVLPNGSGKICRECIHETVWGGGWLFPGPS